MPRPAIKKRPRLDVSNLSLDDFMALSQGHKTFWEGQKKAGTYSKAKRIVLEKKVGLTR